MTTDLPRWFDAKAWGWGPLVDIVNDRLGALEAGRHVVGVRLIPPFGILHSYFVELDAALTALEKSLPAVLPKLPRYVFPGKYGSFFEDLQARVGALIAGGSGGGGYRAGAVHFDGTGSDAVLPRLSIEAVIASDLPALTQIFWVKGEPQDAKATFAVDPHGHYTSAGGFELDGSCHIDATNPDGTFHLSVSADPAIAKVLTGAWTCFIASVEADTGRAKVYVGDVDATRHDRNNAPFAMSTNGLQLNVGDGYGAEIIGDIADYRLLFGVSLIDGSGDIPLATRRLIIGPDGKPVDPSALTAFLGDPGTVLFSGDHAAFPVNQGTGGAFIVTIALTDADTSPSD